MPVWLKFDCDCGHCGSAERSRSRRKIIGLKNATVSSVLKSLALALTTVEVPSKPATSQEIWHKTRLRTTLDNLYLPVDEVVEKIGSLYASRAEQAALRTCPRRDVPAGLWLPKMLAAAEEALKHPQLYAKCVDVGQNRTFWCMRHDTDEPKLVRTGDLERRRLLGRTPASQEVLRLLRTIYMSKDGRAVWEAMRALPGTSTAEEVLLRCANTLRKWVLIELGGEATAVWQSPSTMRDEIPCWHGLYACYGCHAFSTWGCCHHGYAVLIDAGHCFASFGLQWFGRTYSPGHALPSTCASWKEARAQSCLGRGSGGPRKFAKTAWQSRGGEPSSGAAGGASAAPNGPGCGGLL